MAGTFRERESLESLCVRERRAFGHGVVESLTSVGGGESVNTGASSFSSSISNATEYISAKDSNRQFVSQLDSTIFYKVLFNSACATTCHQFIPCTTQQRRHPNSEKEPGASSDDDRREFYSQLLLLSTAGKLHSPFLSIIYKE